MGCWEVCFPLFLDKGEVVWREGLGRGEVNVGCGYGWVCVGNVWAGWARAVGKVGWKDRVSGESGRGRVSRGINAAGVDDGSCSGIGS